MPRVWLHRTDGMGGAAAGETVREPLDPQTSPGARRKPQERLCRHAARSGQTASFRGVLASICNDLAVQYPQRALVSIFKALAL